MSCEWQQEERSGQVYATNCEEVVELLDGTPKENGMNYCRYCGKELKQLLYDD